MGVVLHVAADGLDLITGSRAREGCAPACEITGEVVRWQPLLWGRALQLNHVCSNARATLSIQRVARRRGRAAHGRPVSAAHPGRVALFRGGDAGRAGRIGTVAAIGAFVGTDVRFARNTSGNGALGERLRSLSSVGCATIGGVGTALVYLGVMLLVAAVVFLLASLVFGRGEELEPLPPGVSPTRLPERDITGADLAQVRFQPVLRGYKMSEVDWVLQRVGAELDALRTRLAELDPSQAHGYPHPERGDQR